MLSEWDREVAEARIEQERTAQVDAARRELQRAGTVECIDCGSTISLARRRVYPAATRCLECQESAEKEAYLK